MPTLQGGATPAGELVPHADTIYTYLGGSPAVMAIHYGPSGNYNAGSRFRTSMWNDICTWIADVPSSYATHSLCN